MKRILSALGLLAGVVVRVVFLALAVALPVYLFLANFGFFEPYLYPLHLLQGNVRHATKNVLVGPYPDSALLEDLHDRGYNIVVSLLDKHLIYEWSLINKEDAYAHTLGVTEYNFPMISTQAPTSTVNRKALAEIRMLVHKYPNWKIYVHCYLGKHRAGVVAAMLRKASPSKLPMVTSLTVRQLKPTG